MPAMANITVKKADGTTDIVYDALTGAAGDKSEAVWRQDTGATSGLPVGQRSLFRMSSAYNGPRTARVVRCAYKRPYATQDSTTTRFTSTDQDVMSISITLPEAIPASERSEAVHQMLNLLASSLVKSSVIAGYAPQ